MSKTYAEFMPTANKQLEARKATKAREYQLKRAKQIINKSVIDSKIAKTADSAVKEDEEQSSDTHNLDSSREKISADGDAYLKVPGFPLPTPPLSV